jgi:hypothetical protein
MKQVRTAVLTLFSALAISFPVAAQERHVVDETTLDQVVADHVRQTADEREAVRRVLANDEVRKLAEGVGLDLTRAETAIATLDETELGPVAAQAQAVNDALAGGQSSVTISTTVIIIGLLILILLIVAI